MKLRTRIVTPIFPVGWFTASTSAPTSACDPRGSRPLHVERHALADPAEVPSGEVGEIARRLRATLGQVLRYSLAPGQSSVPVHS